MGFGLLGEGTNRRIVTILELGVVPEVPPLIASKVGVPGFLFYAAAQPLHTAIN